MKLPFDHFDLLAPYYDRLIRRSPDDPLPELVAAKPGQTILDVGGGTGRNSYALLATGANVVVCDRSYQMLKQAQARGLPVVRASADHLPFAAHYADWVLVIDAFHHFVVPSPEATQGRAVFELLRVLKPDGRLVMEEPDTRHRSARLIALGERLLLMGSRFLTPEELISRFESAGASALSTNDDGFGVQLVFSMQPPT